MAKGKVNNSIFLNFLKQIAKDKRYWILLVLFCLLLFTGQNISPNDDVGNNVKNINIPEITSDSSIYESKNAIDSKSGEKYHILFQLKANKDGNTSSLSPETVQLSLTDNLGNTQHISDFDIQPNEDSYADEDVVFTTGSHYTNLVFQKNDSASNSKIFVKNIHITRQEGNDVIKPSLIGDFDKSKPVESFSYKDANTVLSTTNSKDKEVGEIFTANSNYLTGAKMKLHFRGNGGNGNYYLVVRELKNGNLSSNNLAQLSFNASTARSIYQINDIDQSYFFPLDARLVPGQKYFIGINSQNVQANYFNNLRIFGNPAGSSVANGRQILSENGKTKDKISNFYIRYYFASQQTYNGENVNFGDKFDDLGNGTGIYSYSSSSAHSSLDIFESGEDFVTYKINTFYPFQKLYLEAVFSASYLNSDSRLLYSFDNKSWSVFEKKKDINSINKYEQQILGDHQNKTVYIKSTGQSTDKTTFNFNSLNINASVSINN
jgi:hypothetical protein